MEIKNAIIESAIIDIGERNLLTVWLQLNYGSGSQGFGGYALYIPKDYDHATIKGDFAGHFIYRCMQIAGVERWSDIIGKTIRVKSDWNKVESIGHIVKDDWFNPSQDFKSMSLEGKEKEEQE